MAIEIDTKYADPNSSDFEQITEENQKIRKLQKKYNFWWVRLFVVVTLLGFVEIFYSSIAGVDTHRFKFIVFGSLAVYEIYANWKLKKEYGNKNIRE